MAFTKKTWKARTGTGLNKYRINGQVYTLENVPDEVVQAGDVATPETMNDLEQRIADAFDDEHEYLTAILAANETTVSFTDDSIVAGCRVHVFVPMDKCKLVYDAISIPSEGHLNITFPAQETDTVIQVTIDNPLT